MMTHRWIFLVKRLDRNYDGDTFSFALDIGFGLTMHKTVRLSGVDTPELRGGSPATKAAARYARDVARELIDQATEVLFESTVWSGKYGRTIGTISIDGEDLGDKLLAARLGVRYGGGNRAVLKSAHEANAAWLEETGAIALPSRPQ